MMAKVTSGVDESRNNGLGFQRAPVLSLPKGAVLVEYSVEKFDFLTSNRETESRDIQIVYLLKARPG